MSEDFREKWSQSNRLLEFLEEAFEDIEEREKALLRDIRDHNSCAAGMCIGALEVVDELRAALEGET